MKYACTNPNKLSIFHDFTAAVFKLPYRLIFAVATLNSVYIYDTESSEPIAVLAGVHYAAITDLSWYIMLALLIVSLNIQ